MCCEVETVGRSWLTTVADIASEGARRCLAWMPCSSVRNRIHPTGNEVPNRDFLSIDPRKRLHIIHMCPDSTHPSVLVGFSRKQCQDATDGGSPGNTSMEEYWFTKSSRPLRLQKNPCRCSFRRSMKLPLKPKEETKDSVDNVRPGVQRKAKSNAQKKLENVHHLSVQPASQIVERIADSLSAEIINQVIEECISSIHIRHEPHCFDVISTSVEHLANDVKQCPCNDTVCMKDIEFSLEEFGKFEDFSTNCDAMKGCQTTGGYMNPTFVGSNGTIDKLTDDNNVDKHIESDTKLCGSSQNHSTRHNSIIKGVNQDYNANEKNIISKKNKLNDSEKIQEDFVERRHHRDCSHSSKPCQKKPLLLFIHGAGNSAQVWKSLMTVMVEAGYECVAPDLLGHGLSSAPHRASCYIFHSLLTDLLRVFDRFVAKGRSAVILGHGYGFATAISRFRAEQVVQLVLISGGGPSPLSPPPCMSTCLEPLLLCGFKRDVMYSMYGKQLVECSAEDAAVPPIILHNLAKGHFWPEGDAAFHRRITAPTLLVHGLRDPHVTLVQQCEMERTIPRSFLEVIPEAGHWPMLEAPESLSHMVLCFVDWWGQ